MMRKSVMALVGVLLLSPAMAQAVEISDSTPGISTTVLAYFRFGEDQFPDASVKLDQFDAHLRLLSGDTINVVSLPDALADLRTPITPEAARRQVAITIDNAYRSVYDHAWPRLKALGLPFTLFIATDLIDGGAPAYMSWDQIRELAAAGVTIGLRGAAHAHLPGLPDLALLKDIRHGLSRLEAELGITARLFSYPYGEYSNRVINVLDSHGFVAAFGQHSGAMAPEKSPFALPRFPITEQFADSERFELAVNALPLVISDRTPADNALDVAKPQIGFTVAEAMGSIARLTCFATGQGQLSLTKIGRRVELRLTDPFEPGRARVNCTLPLAAAPGEEPSRWRWLGMNFYLP